MRQAVPSEQPAIFISADASSRWIRVPLSSAEVCQGREQAIPLSTVMVGAVVRVKPINRSLRRLSGPRGITPIRSYMPCRAKSGRQRDVLSRKFSLILVNESLSACNTLGSTVQREPMDSDLLWLGPPSLRRRNKGCDNAHSSIDSRSIAFACAALPSGSDSNGQRCHSPCLLQGGRRQDMSRR
jgi:hypothetical protein